MGQFLANSLGSEETTLYKMVAAYAMFANGGERVEPTLVDRVQDRYGRTVYRHDPRDCVDCDDATRPRPRPAHRVEPRAGDRCDHGLSADLDDEGRGRSRHGWRAINLPVPVAGKTGTTNDARDVWFVGFTSNIVAGCYIGYDQPRGLGRGAYGASMCGPVFQEFMSEAIKKYGGGPFEVPPGGHFIKIDRYTGARLPDDAQGEFVVAEYFRDGEEPIFGFSVSMAALRWEPIWSCSSAARASGQEVTTSTGRTGQVGRKASFGSMSSGGLY